MKKEKQVCDFDIKNFNEKKRTGVEKAARPAKGNSAGGGKPNKNDITPPVISAIVTSSTTSSSVTISWVTNEASSCQVQYGTTTAYGSAIPSTGTTSHSVTLTGLSTSSIYNFRIGAVDARGNSAFSANQTFATGVEAVNVIYLEFYGTTVANTLWNVSGPIVATHSGLTAEEIEQVITAVAGDYVLWNVVVTNDIDLYINTPSNRKVRVVLTEAHEWYGNNAAGVAYLNSFGWSDQSPAWVFTALLSHNVHYIAEACSHEIGHTLGLRHQSQCVNGVITAQYNPGENGLAPIMGVSYNVPSGDWWIGPTPLGCPNIQDDIPIISNRLGLK